MSTTESVGSQISGHADPAGEPVWAMQLALRVEKSAPPSVTLLAQATAGAVVSVLAEDRALPGGEWEPLIARWSAGRIRKVVRRARGAAWDKVQPVPGVTFAVQGVQVRAFVPGPTDQTPEPVRKLQVSGSELDDPDRVVTVPSSGVVVAVSPHLQMSAGKVCAQVGHAAQKAWLEMPQDARSVWRNSGLAVAVVHPDPTDWLEVVRRAPVQITDAGFTEIPAGSKTTCALW